MWHILGEGIVVDDKDDNKGGAEEEEGMLMRDNTGVPCMRGLLYGTTACPRLGRGFGHMFNDAVHTEATGRRNNCCFVFRSSSSSPSPFPPPHPCADQRAYAYLRTTRHVRAGQELLVPYHVTYWSERAPALAKQQQQQSKRVPKRMVDFCARMGRISKRLLDRHPPLVMDDYRGRGRGAVCLPYRDGDGGDLKEKEKAAPQIVMDIDTDDAEDAEEE